MLFINKDVQVIKTNDFFGKGSIISKRSRIENITWRKWNSNEVQFYVKTYKGWFDNFWKLKAYEAKNVAKCFKLNSYIPK